MVAIVSATDAARYPAAQQRAAKLGWSLAWTGAEFELTGNGGPAAFGRLDSFLLWLEYQEKGKAR